MGIKRRKVKLNPLQQSELERLCRQHKTGQMLHRRARLILLLGQGKSCNAAAKIMGAQPRWATFWCDRYLEQGLEGLNDADRSGRPGLEVQVEHKVVMTVCRKPPGHLSRWSVNTLARHLGMAHTTVQQILQRNDLHPHRIKTFTFSPDPKFEEKLLEVVGLYMNPPQNALVLCVDEKTGIQALDRTQPMLPLKAKKARSWTNEYVRHGTRVLLACLDIAKGKVVAEVRRRRTSKDFLEFMDKVAATYPRRKLCVVLDNLNTHNNEAARQWLQKHPRVSFHYTPTHASWVNLIEVFFSILTRQGLQQSVMKSARQLERFLKTYIHHYNQRCGPFEWTKGPDKLQRIIQLTKNFQENKLPEL